MADDGDAERLVVLLEARIRDFEKNMAKASGTATRDYNRMRTGSRTATQQMEGDMVRSTGRINHALASTSTRMGSFARSGLSGMTSAFVAGVAPILSVAAALRTAREALSEFDRLGNRADMFGVAVESLQELRFAAEQSGMAVDNFDTAFRRFIRRSAEAAQGTGAAKGAFEELGISLHDANGQLKASEDLLREVADALQRVPNQADRLRLAFRMFDTDGAMMTNVLAEGAAGLDEMAERARELGIVIETDTIRRAQEMKRELDTATQAIRTNFQQALIDLAPILISTAQLAANVAGAIRTIGENINWMSGNLDRLGSGRLDDALAGLGAERIELENQRLRMAQEFAEFGAAIRSGDTAGLPEFLSAELEYLNNRLEGIAAQEAEILDILERRRNVPLPPPMLEPEDMEDSGTGGGGSGRNRAAEDAIRQAEAIARVVETLEAERVSLGKTALQQRIDAELRRAGIDATHESAAAIGQLVAEINGAAVTMANRSPFEIMADQMRELDELLAHGAISWETYGRAAAQAQAQAVTATMGSLAQMSSMLSSAFEDSKALSVATAALKGAESVASSFAAGAQIGGPPVGFAYAAIAGAAAAANLAAVMAARPGSTTVPQASGGGGAMPRVPAPVAAPRQAPTQHHEIHLYGLDKDSLFDGETMIRLLERLNQLQKDNWITGNVRFGG